MDWREIDQVVSELDKALEVERGRHNGKFGSRERKA